MTGSTVTNEELWAQGWAPGEYLIRCKDENHVATPGDILAHQGAKRCTRCHACATQRALAARLTPPRLETAAPMSALQVLRAVEWSGVTDLEEGGSEQACPYCGEAKRTGHRDACALAYAISQS